MKFSSCLTAESDLLFQPQFSWVREDFASRDATSGCGEVAPTGLGHRCSCDHLKRPRGRCDFRRTKASESPQKVEWEFFLPPQSVVRIRSDVSCF
jgi:hypothetical protein